MTNLPTCPTCRTDEHLVFTHYRPGYASTVTSRPYKGSTVTRRQWVPPVVEYTCAPCGTSGGQVVPDDWAPSRR